MTEAKWLSWPEAIDPAEAHALMLRTARETGDPRKLRLLACASARRVWLLLPKACKKAVEVAERFADGLAVTKELHVAARKALSRAQTSRVARPAVGHGATAVYHAATPDARGGALGAAFAAQRALLLTGSDPAAEARAHCRLIHDVFGNPFRPARLDDAWLGWHDRCVVRIARAVYDERRFGDLPILHDALLDAGCDDDDVLAHCREPGEHVRGCWVLDLLLGKA